MDLEIGTKIKIGVEYAKEHALFEAGEIIELIKGTFDEDNGLYTYESHAPAIWSDYEDDFESIYHLFGNDLENFMDCEII